MRTINRSSSKKSNTPPSPRRDFLSLKERSALMGRIKSERTEPEMVIARFLKKSRLRFRRYNERLPGKPDFTLPEYRLIVNVDGEFWHGRDFNRWKKSLKPYWLNKITRNILRDRRNGRKLRASGWKVIRIWDTDVLRDPAKCLSRILCAISPAQIQ